jgi:hypothetical protein
VVSVSIRSSDRSALSLSIRLLNLKNDALRRKFDAIKYDVQKIEEVREQHSRSMEIRHQRDFSRLT